MSSDRSSLALGLAAGIGASALAFFVQRRLLAGSSSNGSSNSKERQATRTAAMECLYAQPGYFSIALTGGGGSLVSWMLGVPGCSGTMLDVSVPYAREAMPLLIPGGEDKEWHCNTSTAQSMAQAAFDRAADMQRVSTGDIKPAAPVYGLSCTCALVSNRWRRGEHRIHVCVRGKASQVDYTLKMKKGNEGAPFRTRVQEDELTGE